MNIIKMNKIKEPYFNKKNKMVVLENKSVSGIDIITVESIFQECDTVNQNRRMYPKQQVLKQINDVKEKIRNRQLMGELDHPMEQTDINRMQDVRLGNVSHLITKLQLNGNKVIGNFETLPTPNGIILKNLILNEVTLGISLRQLGTQEENVINGEKIDVIIPEDFELITYDVVSEPSFKNQIFNVFKESQSEILDTKQYQINDLNKYIYEQLYYNVKKILED